MTTMYPFYILIYGKLILSCVTLMNSSAVINAQVLTKKTCFGAFKNSTIEKLTISPSFKAGISKCSLFYGTLNCTDGLAVKLFCCQNTTSHQVHLQFSQYKTQRCIELTIQNETLRSGSLLVSEHKRQFHTEFGFCDDVESEFELQFTEPCSQTTPVVSTTPPAVTTQTKESSKSTPSDAVGPIIEKSGRKAQYQRDLKIILGTVFGVACVFAICFLVVCWRNRQSRSGRGDAEDTELFDNLGVNKNCPSVLLLYANDFAAHVRCVASLARWLLQEANCNVHLDIWETEVIQLHGRLSWLKERLASSDFVFIVSSTAARLLAQQRTRKLVTQPIQQRAGTHKSQGTSTDPFPLMLTPVLAEINHCIQKNESLERFLVLQFPYATSSDMPAACLERVKCLRLPTDLQLLCRTLHSDQSLPRRSRSRSISELEQALVNEIQHAELYLNENPGWIYELFEPWQESEPSLRQWRSEGFALDDSSVCSTWGRASVASSVSSATSSRRRRHTISDWVLADVHRSADMSRTCDDLSLPCMECGAYLTVTPLQLPVCRRCVGETSSNDSQLPSSSNQPDWTDTRIDDSFIETKGKSIPIVKAAKLPGIIAKSTKPLPPVLSVSKSSELFQI